MSILAIVFEVVKYSLHYGPGLEPFFRALITEHDALQTRVDALEAERVADKAMMDQLRAEWAAMFPPRSAEAPIYITDPIPDQEPAVSSAATAEQNPAEPVQTPVADLPKAQPEPAPAGPNTEPGDGAPDIAPVEEVKPV